jgi:hypothetical protein
VFSLARAMVFVLTVTVTPSRVECFVTIITVAGGAALFPRPSPSGRVNCPRFKQRVSDRSNPINIKSWLLLGRRENSFTVTVIRLTVRVSATSPGVPDCNNGEFRRVLYYYAPH